MVSVFDSRSGGASSSPGRGHCVVFLGKTLYSHSVSLHPGVQMGTSKCAGGNPCDGPASHPGGSSNTPSRFMLRKPELSTCPIGHSGPYKGFTYLLVCKGLTFNSQGLISNSPYYLPNNSHYVSLENLVSDKLAIS